MSQRTYSGRNRRSKRRHHQSAPKSPHSSQSQPASPKPRPSESAPVRDARYERRLKGQRRTRRILKEVLVIAGVLVIGLLIVALFLPGPLIRAILQWRMLFGS